MLAMGDTIAGLWLILMFSVSVISKTAAQSCRKSLSQWTLLIGDPPRENLKELDGSLPCPFLAAEAHMLSRIRHASD